MVDCLIICSFFVIIESVGFSDKVSATFKQGVEKVKGKVDQIDEKLGVSINSR